MTPRDQLAALDHEFNRVGSTMHMTTYGKRHEELSVLAAEERESAPAPVPGTPTPAPAAPASADDRTVTVGVLKRTFGLAGKAIKSAIDRACDARFGELEARIKTLEERLPLAYGGTFADGQQSNKGLFYTYSGSVWYCRETTRDRPGVSVAFVLACKRGGDGRDSR